MCIHLLRELLCEGVTGICIAAPPPAVTRDVEKASSLKAIDELSQQLGKEMKKSGISL